MTLILTSDKVYHRFKVTTLVSRRYWQILVVVSIDNGNRKYADIKALFGFLFFKI